MSSSQSQEKIDSLKSILTREISDLSKVDVLTKLSSAFYPKQLDSAMFYGLMLSTLCERIDNNIGSVEAMKIIGHVYYSRKDYSNSIEYYQEGIALLETIGAHANLIIPLQVSLMKAHIGNGAFEQAVDLGLSLVSMIEGPEVYVDNKGLVFKNLGNAYLGCGDIETALFYYKKDGEVYMDGNKIFKTQIDNAKKLLLKRDYVHSLEILLPLIDMENIEQIASEHVLQAYTLVGEVYRFTKKLDDAIFYLKKAENYTDRDSNPSFFIRNGHRIGIVYRETKQYDKAKALYIDILNLAKLHDIGTYRNKILRGLGYTYYNTNLYDSALYYFRESLDWAQGQKNDYWVAQAYSSLGENYFEMNQLDNAKDMFKKAKINFELMDEDKLSATQLMYSYLALYMIDTLENRFDKNTFLNHKKYYMWKEKVSEMQQKKERRELELSYMDEKKDNKIKLLVAENNLQKSEVVRQKNQRAALIIGSAMLMLLLVVLINRYLIKKKALNIITKQRQAIVEKNQENELLIQEIHHRVKNNLQIMLSLMNAQKYSSYGNKRAMDIIIESQNKIKSMALLHENLYNSDNFSKVATKNYFGSLITHIKNSYKDDNQSVEIKSNIENNEIGMNLAVSLGLIVNELITNAYKYAFKNYRSDKLIDIKFEIDKETNIYQLEVLDNGQGLPGQFNIQTSKSFGLQMVSGLVAQFNGNLKIVKDNGTKFIISIKDQEPVFDGQVA